MTRTVIATGYNSDPMSEPKRTRKPRTKSNTDTWKAAERKIAGILGGHIVEAGDDEHDDEGNKKSERIPVTGRRRGSAADIRHPKYSIEAKHGKQIPKLLTEAMDQAEASVRSDRIPMVVFHPHGARYDECLVIFRIKDLPRVEGK